MHANQTIRAALGWALQVVVALAVLAALRNFGDAWQLESGLRALGPTVSVLAGLVLLTILAALALTVRRRPAVFVALAAVCCFSVLVAAVGTFVQSPSLWPSDSWRRAGALLNVVGLGTAAAAATIAVFRWKAMWLTGGGKVVRLAPAVERKAPLNVESHDSVDVDRAVVARLELLQHHRHQQ